MSRFCFEKVIPNLVADRIEINVCLYVGQLRFTKTVIIQWIHSCQISLLRCEWEVRSFAFVCVCASLQLFAFFRVRAAAFEKRSCLLPSESSRVSLLAIIRFVRRLLAKAMSALANLQAHVGCGATRGASLLPRLACGLLNLLLRGPAGSKF